MKQISLPSVEILPASHDDLAAIQQIAHTIWFEHYPGIISNAQISYMLAQDYTVESLSQDLERGVSIDRLILNSELQGFAAYGRYDDTLDFKLHKLYVMKSFHGQGLGSTLLAHVEKKCANKGAQRLVLNVNKNNDKAIRAYQRNGYVKLESVVVDIGGGFVMDDYIMGKTL
ncbi:MAG: GNAT family N-acetyltransferase, partial [Pseudomonadales bacterium]